MNEEDKHCMVSRNFIVKNAENFLNTAKKFLLQISYRHREIVIKEK